MNSLIGPGHSDSYMVACRFSGCSQLPLVDVQWQYIGVKVLHDAILQSQHDSVFFERQKHTRSIHQSVSKLPPLQVGKSLYRFVISVKHIFIQRLKTSFIFLV